MEKHMDKATEKALVCDAKCDILRTLNIVTDEHRINPDAAEKFTSAYEKLFKVEQEMSEAGVEAAVMVNTTHEADHAHTHTKIDMTHVAEMDSWGKSDSNAKAYFMNLMEHYQGFWRCAAEYAENPTPEIKQHMLMHFQKQLEAHDKIAEFVKGRCPGLCPEIMQILQNWGASKGM